MKKLVFLFVAFAAISFASCGNQNQAAEEVADTDSVVVVEDSAAVDTAAADTAAAVEAPAAE
ncbi:MAG: hypothetical protein IJ553_02240 [Alloprevotella sp.]|nr:hypothetical protein [Alloprevotella sp.]